MIKRPLTPVFASLAALLLLTVPLAGRADSGLGTRVPLPTAAGQIPVSVSVGGTLSYQPVGFLYSDGVHTTFGGGTASTTSVLTANVVNAADGGLQVNLPSGTTGNAIQVNTSTGALAYGVIGSNGNTDAKFLSGAGFKFFGYGGGMLIASMRSDQVNFSAPFYGTSAASFPSYGEWSGGYGPAVPTYLVNNSTYPIVIGATSTVQTGSVIDLAKPVVARSSVSGTPGSGTSIAGGSLTLTGGQSTGTGAEGSVYLATSGTSTTSGTALNSLTNRVQVTSAGLNVLGSGVYQAAGVPGYTGAIPSTFQSLNYHSGILTGYINSAGTQVGNP